MAWVMKLALFRCSSDDTVLPRIRRYLAEDVAEHSLHSLLLHALAIYRLSLPVRPLGLIASQPAPIALASLSIVFDRYCIFYRRLLGLSFIQYASQFDITKVFALLRLRPGNLIS